ncbi:MAG: NAD(P)-binding protein [Pirellulaceae bacterium]|nr:NAD(P)-binding protein [Pirellulaceae bacterium]
MSQSDDQHGQDSRLLLRESGDAVSIMSKQQHGQDARGTQTVVASHDARGIQDRRVAIVGSGLAGLAAAARLVERGISVALFESRRTLGGRAGSFVEPATHLLTDHGQHVSMGCCTALADLLRRTGLDDTFETHRRLTFIGPDGRRHAFAATRLLPAPLHLLPSLLRLGFLSFADRWSIIRAIQSLKRATSLGATGVPPVREQDANEQSIASWLHRHNQSQSSIDHFWIPLLVSALSETLDHISLAAARQVIVDGLMASRRAYELRIPRLPLAEIFDRRLGDWLESRGTRIHRLARVARVEGDARRARGLVLRDGRRLEFDAFIVAVPWDRVGGVLSAELTAVVPELKHVERLRPAAITTVHLAYDRPVLDVPHALLVGRLGQWVFRKPENRVQIVISASHRLVDMPREQLARHVERELAEMFPAAVAARVTHRRVVVQPRAVFTPTPGSDRLRPAQQTPIDNLALAGDWTATGWPATMEGAVRSGVAAADAILRPFG